MLGSLDRKCKEVSTRGEDQSDADDMSVTVSSGEEKATKATNKPEEQAGDTKSAQSAKQDDIKQRAHQLLMQARKKAGASSALPKERLAEIKGQNLRRESSFTQEYRGGNDDKSKETEEGNDAEGRPGKESEEPSMSKRNDQMKVRRSKDKQTTVFITISEGVMVSTLVLN